MPFSGEHILHYLLIGFFFLFSLFLVFKETLLNKFKKKDKKIDKGSVLKCLTIAFIFLFTILHVVPCPLHVYGKATANMQNTTCAFCTTPTLGATPIVSFAYEAPVMQSEKNRFVLVLPKQYVTDSDRNKSPPHLG